MYKQERFYGLYRVPPYKQAWPGRTEAAETVCRDVVLRVKQDSHNYTYWSQSHSELKS